MNHVEWPVRTAAASKRSWRGRIWQGSRGSDYYYKRPRYTRGGGGWRRPSTSSSHTDDDEGSTAHTPKSGGGSTVLQLRKISNEVAPGTLPGKYKGWHLYFNTDISELSHLTKLVTAFEQFFSPRQLQFGIQQEFEKQESFSVDVKKLLEDEDIIHEIPNFDQVLIREPETIINAMGLAMHQILSEKLDDMNNEQDSTDDDEDTVVVAAQSKISGWPEGERMGLICARLINVEPRTPMKNLKASFFGKLVSIKGTVVRVSSIKPLCVKMAFTCLTCGQIAVLPLPEGKYSVPSKCSSRECRGRTFDLERDSPYTELVNWQTVKLLEMSDDRDEARVPRSIECELYGDLVRSCSPGDVVSLTGILKVNNSSDGHSRRQEDSCTFSLFIEANSVQNSSRSTSHVDRAMTPAAAAPLDASKLGIEFTPRDLEFVSELHSDPHLFRLVVHSLCPAIYGHELVKAGLLLGLFGGTRKFVNGKDHIPVRGEPHVLVVGDPGLGKSQMLQACAGVSPRGVYVCGNNATTSGLTVTLSKEGAATRGCEHMEAGALVLSDEGCCCIDEFDKMGQQQQQALLEVMEQQNVSIAKAGVLCNLTARASILAAANPFGGHYDRGRTVSENLKLSGALLSRFDLVFILVDRPDEEVDAMLSGHVIAQRLNAASSATNVQNSPQLFLGCGDTLAGHAPHSAASSLRERLKLKAGESPLDTVPHVLLRKYIAYARTYVHPRLSPAAADLLQAFYISLRKEHHGRDSTPITLRQLESLVRLSEARARLELREEVTVEDAKEVVEIFKHSMIDTLSDALGTIHFERSQHGSGMSKQSVAKKFIAVLNNEFERTSNAHFTFQQMRQIAKESELQITDFESFIESLNNHGFLLRKGPKLYQLHTV